MPRIPKARPRASGREVFEIFIHKPVLATDPLLWHYVDFGRSTSSSSSSKAHS
jgi:hypothetical protein